MTDTELLKKRFIELSRRSFNAGIYTFTPFLGLSELSVFEEIKSTLPYKHYELFGGHADTERKMIRFGRKEDIGYPLAFPISILKISPVSQKFTEKLTHRDYLGSLMALGLERDTLGDIAIFGTDAYLFLKEDMVDYVRDSLFEIRNTSVTLSEVSHLPDGELFKTEERTVQLSSERLDALIAKVFFLSRDASQALFKRGLVFVSGKLIESVSYTPKKDDIISVRGYGRMKYLSYESLSRKGKLNARVALYI